MNLARVVDTVLDRSVVGGYTRLGYLARRRSWPADDPRPDALRGRTAVVTGAGSGLGKATVAGMARLGASVHLVVRDVGKGRAAVEEVRRDVPDADLHVVRCDVSDLSDVRALAADLVGELDRVDVLVHNAGVLPPERRESVDGHEITLATHVLGPVLLTELLRPLLRTSDTAGRSRVIVVSSGGMYTQALHAADAADIEYLTGDYNGTTAYARTKRMQVALAPVLQRRWGGAGGDGIDVHVMHPGWADTPGVLESLPGFHRVMGPLLRDPASGADTVVWLAATEPAPPGGRFWHDRAPRPEHFLPTTHDDADAVRRLWDYVRAQLDLAPR